MLPRRQGLFLGGRVSTAVTTKRRHLNWRGQLSESLCPCVTTETRHLNCTSVCLCGLQQRRCMSTGLASSQSSSRKATQTPSREATQTRTVRYNRDKASQPAPRAKQCTGGSAMLGGARRKGTERVCVLVRRRYGISTGLAGSASLSSTATQTRRLCGWRRPWWRLNHPPRRHAQRRAPARAAGAAAATAGTAAQCAQVCAACAAAPVAPGRGHGRHCGSRALRFAQHALLHQSHQAAATAGTAARCAGTAGTQPRAQVCAACAAPPAASPASW